MAFVRKSDRSDLLKTVVEAKDALSADNTAEIDRRVKAEVEKLRNAGYADGYAAGQEAAKLEIEAYRNRLANVEEALVSAVDELTAPIKSFEDVIEDIILKCAFRIVELCSLSGGSFQESGARVLEYIWHEVSGFSFAKRVEIRLNPEDLAILAAEPRDANVHYIGDKTVLRGGVVVEVFGQSNDPFQNIGWDASIQAKLALIRDGLGVLAKSDG
jgi:flagellar biosynthesis/type III secretory pathway protein FliH